MSSVCSLTADRPTRERLPFEAASMVDPAHTRRAGLPAHTSPGAVRLIAADTELLRGYYESAIGLRTLDTYGDSVLLGAGERPLVELVSRPDAPPRPPGTTGLFHLALLVPSRPDLARALRRALEAGERLTGASDHIVSEALYLRDPEGNGIEIYRDRPRKEWRWAGGEVEMDTLPLDVDSVMSELSAQRAANGMPEGTVMGHVHLNVSDLGSSEEFYVGALGFDVTVRGYPGALFVSAGGYHHHVGLNTWSGPGAPPPPTGARGLARFELALPAGSDLGEIEDRLARAGAEPVRSEEGLLVSDPSRNRLLVRAGERESATSSA
jgi:catechol 2,3-dioxygenase